MGFSEAEASIAMERCGPDSSIAKLTNFICAAQMAKVTDTFLPVKDGKPLCNDPNYKKRRNLGYDFWERNKQKKLEKKLLNEDDHAIHLLIPMIGSGSDNSKNTSRRCYEHIPLPNSMIDFTKPDQITQRTLPEDAMSTFLFKINDWLYQTRSDNSKNTSRRCYEHMAFVPVNVWTGISQYLFDVEPEFVDSKHFHATTLKRAIFIILPIKNRFSLILLPPLWVGRNKVAPLEPDEVEMLLGFLKNHTRGGGSARDMFPSDINVLFLFAGISAAEVAFYCLSISLKTDVQELNDDRLEQLMSRFGGFDLVVGSIPCNNLDGSNKHHHDELEDFCWCIFLQ
ncbi:hypothetical protein F3Y22_tig00110678pilonHSYRG00252 [Hibiscus syriacus]|uniref:DNA (Cytosine-5)-methyltransferase DRM1/2 n=1 Tax=Hibiscus syriacus TaxID=106335 RepID=A0A6A2ZXI3_HIBSY|nr:hypothetical protein F3Y22_tig00110678pilonHSYRG00252 [Hibiscus syriacus]